MINGNIINGNVINGMSGLDIYANPFDSIQVSENVKVGMNYGLHIDENLSVLENVKFLFNKGMPINEGVTVSESQNIVTGFLYQDIQDAPIVLSEVLSYNLQKGVLMEDLIQYYLGLLIVQYRSKPKALAHVRNIVRESLCDLLPSILNEKFNIDSAEGDQLDKLGKYIGIERRVKTYGSDVTLSDDDYRLLLKIKRSKNILGPCLGEIDEFINTFLKNVVIVFDHKNMSMSYALNSTVVSNTLAQAIMKQDILPRPMGVSKASIIYIDNLDNVFGFRSYTFNEGTQVGFNSYSNYNPAFRLLTYGDTI